MKRSIYVVYDQVSHNFGNVVDFANVGDCIRAFKNMCISGAVPPHMIKDTAIMHIADVDYSRGSPVVETVIPAIVFYGSETLVDKESIDHEKEDC